MFRLPERIRLPCLFCCHREYKPADTAPQPAGLYLLTLPLNKLDLRMTRSDLVEQLIQQFGQLNHKDTEFAIQIILDTMAEALAHGHRIEIRGFGSFFLNHHPPRSGRNPRSGAQVMIPERTTPHFKPGKRLRESVDCASSSWITAQPQETK